MTIIVWDGRYIAADGMVMCGNNRVGLTEKKILLRNGVIYASCGIASLFMPLIEWYEAGADVESVPRSPTKEEGDTDLFVWRNGKCTVFGTDAPYAEEIDHKHAWGMGAEIAIGAMDAGAGARKAVEIAIARNVYLGGEIQVVDVESIATAAAPTAELAVCEHELTSPGGIMFGNVPAILCWKCGEVLSGGENREQLYPRRAGRR